jgi:hypothetical protein
MDYYLKTDLTRMEQAVDQLPYGEKKEPAPERQRVRIVAGEKAQGTAEFYRMRRPAAGGTGR